MDRNTLFWLAVVFIALVCMELASTPGDDDPPYAS